MDSQETKEIHPIHITINSRYSSTNQFPEPECKEGKANGCQLRGLVDLTSFLNFKNFLEHCC